MHFVTHALALLVVALTVGDCFSTILALRRSDVTEANPVIAFIMRLTGPKWVIPRMLFGLVNVALPLLSGDTVLSAGMLAANAVLLAWVVWHNLQLAWVK